MAKKHAAAAAAGPEDLELLREMLRGGPHRVRGTILAEDGPVGQPTPLKGAGGWYAAAVADRDVVVTGLRLEAEVGDRTVAADIGLPPWIDADPEAGGRELSREVAAGGIAHAFVPDEPGLGRQGE